MHSIRIYFVTGYVVMLLPYFALLRLILYEEEDQLHLHPFQASQAVIKRVSPDLSEHAGKIERMSVGYWYLLGRITFPNI